MGSIPFTILHILLCWQKNGFSFYEYWSFDTFLGAWEYNNKKKQKIINRIKNIKIERYKMDKQFYLDVYCGSYMS